MSALAVYALEVPAGDVIVEAAEGFSGAGFRITMAAIDPSAPPVLGDSDGMAAPPRATLKLLRQDQEFDEDSDDEDMDEDEYLKAIMGGSGMGSDSESDSDEDEKVNGGPSDPKKAQTARQAALVKEEKNEEKEEALDLEMKAMNGVNGTKLKDLKGKERASSESSDEMDLDLEKYVLCTLDPEKAYQQPLDITIGPKERVFFQVSGAYTIYLTGNYVDTAGEGHGMYDSDETDEYDLSPDEDELELGIDSEESDELDDIADPRIMELDTDEEKIVPKITKVKEEKVDKKGKNKRAAEESGDEPSTLDELVSKSLKPAEATANGEKKLSKKQLKKLKNAAGEAVPVSHEEKVKVESSDGKISPQSKADKKVQFAKNLEQGPTGTNKETKAEPKSTKTEPGSKETSAKQNGLGIKMVQGVKVDDRKIGKGPAAKKGDRVSMRYIGKLTSGAVFDSNKSGTPFKFKLGFGEVIKGWDIGVEGMAVGGERRITIPAKLAYGSKAQPSIPANSELIFEVKLLEIGGKGKKAY